MEVSGIDPEIVGGQQATSTPHSQASATQQVAQAATQGNAGPGGIATKQEIGNASDGLTGHPGAAVAPGMPGGAPDNAVTAAQHAASLAANQYAAAAAYGPPVPLQTAQVAGPGSGYEAHARVGKRRVRLGWTEEETRNLMEGCKRHGVGNWKKILTDPSFHFNCRTAVDLKDRFRTSFPEEYSRLYPNARTHKVKGKSGTGGVPALIKVSRKERRAFTADEDERLLQGFMKHGPAWSKIQRDQTLGLGDRRSTDLRDRFRNAFPERYTAAGYKGRSSGSKGATSGSSSSNGGSGAGGGDMQIGSTLDDELAAQQHGVINGSRYLPNAQMMQQMQYAQQQYPQTQQYTQGGQRAQQQFNPQAQYQQYGQPMFYNMGLNAQMPMQMANMNQLSQMNQMNPQVRQMPPQMANMNQLGVWPNQQQ